MSLYGTICESHGWQSNSREERIAREAYRFALARWDAAGFGGGEGWNRKQYRKLMKRQAKELERRVYRVMLPRVKANPRAYGFGPIAAWFIGWIVSYVVGKLVSWLLEKWLSGGEIQIMEARAEATQ